MSKAQRRWKGFRDSQPEEIPKEPGKIPGLKFWKRGDKVIFDARQP